MSIINYSTILSSFFPVIVGLVFIRRLNLPLKILLLLFCLGVVEEFGSLYLIVHGFENIWVLNIWTIIDLLLSILILRIWFMHKWLMHVSLILFLLFLGFWGYGIFIYPGIFIYFDIQNTVRTLILVFLSVFPLIDASLDDRIPAYKSHKFWVCAAMLTYNAVAMLVYATSAIKIGEVDLSFYARAWDIRSVINIVTNIMYTYAFILGGRQNKAYS